MKKRIIFLVGMIIIALLLSGCRNPIDIFKSYVFGDTEQGENPLDEGENISVEDIEDLEIPDENVRQTTLYYRDSAGYVVPVVRQIPRVEGIAKAALSALVDSSENRMDLKAVGLQPVLPANTQVELALKEDGLINANFSEEILKVESKAQEESMVKAVVYTLTEFETVDRVQIMVDNKILDTLTYGTDVKEPIARGNINPINNPIEGEQTKITLYMYNNPTGNYTYYVPVTKNIPANNRNVEAAVEELLSSKEEVEQLHFNIPEGTKVYGVNIESGVAYVNFSQHIGELQDEKEIESVTKAVALTLKEFGGIDQVKIMMDGKESSQLGSEPVAVPTFINSY